jgi:type VI secretion system ImpJ/VasE family protein
MSLQIHWHEGLFLQPHHLQRFQKNVFDLVASERLLAWNYPYGAVDARISRDELENQRIRFDHLQVIMPSGLEIDFPRNAELPMIDIKQAFQSNPGGFKVSLGVPIWQDRRANSLEPGNVFDPRAKLIYKVTESDYCDENSGENPKPMQVRRLNARLLLEGEDPSDLEVLPLLRILRSTNEESNIPRQDPDFSGPCLVINASPILRNMVRDLSSQIEASRKELVVQVARGGFSLDTMRGQQFEQIMRLRTLNRYAARLPSLVLAPSVSPFTWYLELRELLGELVALFPDRDEFNVIAYDHDNPVLCFRELSAKIRGYLRGNVQPSYIKVPFKMVDGDLCAAFTDEHFTKPIDYLLGIKTKDDVVQLEAFVQSPEKFKLMPRSGARRAFFGLPLKAERNAPLELPARADLHYFRLQRQERNGERYFESIREEKGAVIKWAENEYPNPDWDIALYMIVPFSSTPAK